MRLNRTNAARLALIVGLTVLLVGVVATLASSARTVRSNGTRVALREELTSTTICQRGPVPAGTTTVRPFFSAVGTGPAISVTLKEGSRLAAKGRRGAGWTGAGVDIPLDRPASLSRRGFICFRVAELPVDIQGDLATDIGAADSESMRMSVEFSAGDRGSWFSRASTVARNFGLGRPASGGVLAAIALLAMVAAATITIAVAAREIR
jgi:hypothetical protein